MTMYGNVIDGGDAEKFERLVRRSARDRAGRLIGFAYWISGNTRANDYVEHARMVHDFIEDADGARHDHMGEWRELYRYDSAGEAEARRIEQKAAHVFAYYIVHDATTEGMDGTGVETMDYTLWLAKSAYISGMCDKLNALQHKGRLFTGERRPIVSMNDRPDYATPLEWTPDALVEMNTTAVAWLAPSIAGAAYRRDFSERWRPELHGMGLSDDGVAPGSIVRIAFAMQQHGMIDATAEYTRQQLREYQTFGTGPHVPDATGWIYELLIDDNMPRFAGWFKDATTPGTRAADDYEAFLDRRAHEIFGTTSPDANHGNVAVRGAATNHTA